MSHTLTCLDVGCARYQPRAAPIPVTVRPRPSSSQARSIASCLLIRCPGGAGRAVAPSREHVTTNLAGEAVDELPVDGVVGAGASACQLGQQLEREPDVSLVRPVPSALSTYTSSWNLWVPLLSILKAISFPSGEPTATLMSEQPEIARH